jgi:hypothetical protein
MIDGITKIKKPLESLSPYWNWMGFYVHDFFFFADTGYTWSLEET